MGDLHLLRVARRHQRPEPVCPQRLRQGQRHSDRHPANPVVRRREVYPSHAPAQCSATGEPDRFERCGQRLHLGWPSRREQLSEAFAPHRLQRLRGTGPQPPYKSLHRPRARGRPGPRRVLCASEVGGVRTQDGLCDVRWADRGWHQIPPQHAGSESERRVDLRHGQAGTRDTATAPDQGALWRAHHRPRLQQHAGRPRRERRLRAQRNPGS